MDKYKIKEAIKENFERQINPETSSYECFFHYTDEKIFEAGFIEGANYVSNLIKDKLSIE